MPRNTKYINPKTGKEEAFDPERKRLFEQTYKVKLQKPQKPQEDKQDS